MDLAEEALKGSQLAGARLIRLLEDRDPVGIEGLKALYPHSGSAYLVGVTGPPGVGKSTLVDHIVAEFRRRQKRVGVIAIDPSSPFSGGAVLGDRVRMQRHATDEGVFIRSMATRGQLGGLSRSTYETSVVLDAMGYDVIVVETVGVGQDELDVVDLAHTTAVVSVPGMGDGIQAMKAGILEIGDLFVLNKADLPGADEAERQLAMMLQLREFGEKDWEPRVLRTVAVQEEGIVELVDALLDHHEYLGKSGKLAPKSEKRDFHFFVELLRAGASEKILKTAERSPGCRAVIEDLKAHRVDPYSAAEALIERLQCEI
jgi:LAO/AO transport system kinase